MAAPARRSVVFVTGNAKKLEEVGGGGCLVTRSGGLAWPGGAGSGPDGRVSLLRSLRSSGTPFPTRWWRRKLTVSWRRGRGEAAARPGPAVYLSAGLCCPQCRSTRGSRTRSPCRSAAKPPGRSFALSFPFPAGRSGGVGAGVAGEPSPGGGRQPGALEHPDRS